MKIIYRTEGMTIVRNDAESVQLIITGDVSTVAGEKSAVGIESEKAKLQELQFSTSDDEEFVKFTIMGEVSQVVRINRVQFLKIAHIIEEIFLDE